MSEQSSNFVVWAEIPVSDLSAAMRFYGAVFDLNLKTTQMGPDTTVILPQEDPGGVVGASLYEGTPAGEGNGITLHLSITGKLEDAIDRCKGVGGVMVTEIRTIPHGRYACFLDLDGNSISLFEPNA